jgi:glycosyltransferase involved in cell wall biosynthesis
VTRLAIIGPLPPFRSGVAQHTMMLAGALAPTCELQLISFSRQYPAWLFPGESDRGGAAALMEHMECQYLLDSLNPLTWRRTIEVVADHRPDTVIIPWWTIFWAPCFFYLAGSLAQHGIPVFFLCHNVLDHEASGWKRALTRSVLRRGAGFLVQSESEQRRLQELVPGARSVVHPHPVFRQFPLPSAELPRRAALELLFFGIVRPYKGLDVLLRAVALLPDRDVVLTVAGEFWGRLDATRDLIDELGLAGRVELVPRYLSESEAAALFTRADAIVMPYLSATGSGVLGLAYHYGKPVIASRIAGLEELVIDGRTGLLASPGSAEGLAEVLGTLSADTARAMRPAIEEFAGRLTWESLARATISHVAGR